MKCQKCLGTQKQKLNYVKGMMICNKCYRKEISDKQPKKEEK